MTCSAKAGLPLMMGCRGKDCFFSGLVPARRGTGLFAEDRSLFAGVCLFAGADGVTGSTVKASAKRGLPVYLDFSNSRDYLKFIGAVSELLSRKSLLTSYLIFLLIQPFTSGREYRTGVY